MKKILLWLTGSLFLLTGCKKDFSTAGFSTIKDENFKFNTYQATLISYSEPVEKVLAQNPPLLSFGAYYQPAFGLSMADVLIQFNNSSVFNSKHFLNADSILFVQLRIPYFSHYKSEESTDSIPVFELDSIFGNDPIRISAYESDYYLFPYDPSTNFTRPQYFYSDFDFLSHTNNLLAHEENFVPSPTCLIDSIYTVGGDISAPDEIPYSLPQNTFPPHFVMDLDTAYFHQKFLTQAGRPVLTDNELFKNYFRGLYLHVEPINDTGNFMLLNAEKIQLVIAYRYKIYNNNGTPNDFSDDYYDYGYEKFILHPAKIIQTYRNAFSPPAQQYIFSANNNTGEDKIYIKGEAGACATIKLFNPVELYTLRNNNWMINQANLRLYVDPVEMAGIKKTEYPDQLLLYKKESKTLLSDLNAMTDEGYVADLPSILKINDGSLHHDDESDQYYYEFNITRHINEVLRKDSANVSLELRVSEPLGNYLQTYTGFNDPDAFVPYGIVLQGNLSVDKPAELIIYYTEPEEE